MFNASSIGIVLRAQAVEAAEAVRGLQGAQVTKTVRITAPVGEDSMPQAIRAALDRAQMAPKRVVVAVPSQEVLLRFFTMPLLPKTEWRSAIQFEVRKYIPFKIEELIWVFHVVEQKSSRQMRVAFMGIRSERLARIQRWLEGAGVLPSHIEAHAVSLSRLAPALAKGGENDFTVVAEVEPDAAHIVITQDHVPYFARDVNLKRVDPAPGEPVADRRPEQLQSELWLSMDFFKRELPSASITQVMLFGEDPALASWCAALSAQLGCPVTMGRAPATAAPSVTVPCVSAVSLTLLSAAKVKFNFLEVAAAKAAKPKPMGRKSAEADVVPMMKAMTGPAVWQAALAGAALVVYGLFAGQQVSGAKLQLARTVHAYRDVGWGLKGRPLEALQPLQEAADKRLGLLKRVMAQRISVTKKLDALTKTLPDGVWFENVQYRDPVDETGESQATLALRGACFLSGSGNEVEAISAFAQRIKQDPAFFQGFATAQLGDIDQAVDATQQHTYWKFQLTSEAARRAF